MVDRLDFEKASASEVAGALVEALRKGIEDVFPDAMANQLYQAWKADAKSLE